MRLNCTLCGMLCDWEIVAATMFLTGSPGSIPTTDWFVSSAPLMKSACARNKGVGRGWYRSAGGGMQLPATTSASLACAMTF